MREEKNKKYILILEDEDIFRDILSEELRREGYEVEVADNGEKGLELMRSRPPDLLLLDIVMPKKDGFEVLNEMKNDPFLKNVPVIVLSNSGDVVELDWAKNLGALEVLVKADFGPQDLLSHIQNVFNTLEGKRSAQRNSRGAETTSGVENNDSSDSQSQSGIDILIVEDEPDLQGLLAVKFEKEGLRIESAGTAGEAISKAQKLKPRVVLLDLLLPDMNGFEVLKKLKEDEETKDIRVIVLSNMGQQADVDKAKKWELKII